MEKTLATLEKGEFFGEMAILNDKPRSASAETIEECEMLVIDRKTFDTLLRSNVEIAIRFIKRIADRLRETNDQMEALMIKDNTSRLVSILAKQVREQKKSGEYSITVDELSGIAGIEDTQARIDPRKAVQCPDRGARRRQGAHIEPGPDRQAVTLSRDERDLRRDVVVPPKGSTDPNNDNAFRRLR